MSWYQFACRDVGQNCDCIVQGETEEELIKNATEHDMKDHGHTEVDIMTRISSYYCNAYSFVTYNELRTKYERLFWQSNE